MAPGSQMTQKHWDVPMTLQMTTTWKEKNPEAPARSREEGVPSLRFQCKVI